MDEPEILVALQSGLDFDVSLTGYDLTGATLRLDISRQSPDRHIVSLRTGAGIALLPDGRSVRITYSPSSVALWERDTAYVAELVDVTGGMPRRLARILLRVSSALVALVRPQVHVVLRHGAPVAAYVGAIDRAPPVDETGMPRARQDARRRIREPWFDYTMGGLAGIGLAVQRDGVSVVELERIGRVAVRGVGNQIGPVATVDREPRPLIRSEGSNYWTATSAWAEAGFTDYGIVNLGQSYGQGAANSDDSTPVYSTPPRDPGYALMPDSPTGVWVDGARHRAYADLESREYRVSGTRIVGETPFPEIANYILARCQERFSAKPRLVFTSSARGGYDVNMLAPGSKDWNDLFTSIACNVEISASQGRRYEVACITLIWGESVFANNCHQIELAVLRWMDELTWRVKHLTGQHRDPVFAVHQPFRGHYDGAVRLGAASRAFVNIHLRAPHRLVIVGPGYAVEHGTDGHPTIYGYRQLGLLYGRAIWRAVFCYGFRPLMVLAAKQIAPNQVALLVNRPDQTALTRDQSGTIIGYPTDPGHIAYIGPGSGSGAHDAQIYASDPAGALGVETAVVGANTSDGLGQIVLTFHRNNQLGGTTIMIAPRPQNDGSNPANATSGTQANGPRSIFRGAAPIGVLADEQQPTYDWIIPQQLEV